MTGFDQQRLLSALMLLIILMFVSSGYPPAGRWRRQLRVAAITLFAVALAIAFVQISLWLVGRGR